MPSRALPARPDLEHLKNEAKALHKSATSGDPDALQRLRAALGDAPSAVAPRLADAQRAVAREYGFPTWARLRSHVQASRGGAQAVLAFLDAVQQQDAERARRVLAQAPRIGVESLHVAAVVGDLQAARHLVAQDPSRVRERLGAANADPLLLLCYSPFHGESRERDAGILATARFLLESGADPNTRDARYGVPALYAVTGLHNVLPLARLLLDAGANPNDGESVFHAAERFHHEALELLLSAGADLDYVGEWGNTALYFLLRWHDVENELSTRKGFDWLLAHGSDPNVVCAKERETSLHVAVRRGQGAQIVTSLLDHGADVDVRRGDGKTAWVLAKRAGRDDLADVLARAGARTETLEPPDLLLAACARGDAREARERASRELVDALRDEDRALIVESAARGRGDSVAACIAAGFPVGAMDAGGATALHYAALRGDAHVTRAVLHAGADHTIRDAEHSSTPLGWAFFGADFVRTPGGEYEATVRALLDAGARPRDDEHRSTQAGIQALLRRHGRA